MKSARPFAPVVTRVTLILLLTLGTLVPIALSLVERERPAAHRALELEYLPKGEYLRVAVLGYRQIAADLIWLKAVYQFGERKQTRAGYRWAYHAVDVLTDLDPKFSMAYYAAGTILGVWSGQVKESIAILEKGMRHNPDMCSSRSSSATTITMNCAIQRRPRSISVKLRSFPARRIICRSWRRE